MTSVELDGSALKSSVAFTGRLACMSRAEAFEVVRQCGGTPSPAVTQRTQVLIVGELGWPLLDDGRPSNKLDRATALGIPIVTERRFLVSSCSPLMAQGTIPMNCSIGRILPSRLVTLSKP